jgi:hypothetical protein
LFPLLPKGNLHALANDIATTGQVDPIIAIAGTDVTVDAATAGSLASATASPRVSFCETSKPT